MKILETDITWGYILCKLFVWWILAWYWVGFYDKMIVTIDILRVKSKVFLNYWIAHIYIRIISTINFICIHCNYYPFNFNQSKIFKYCIDFKYLKYISCSRTKYLICSCTWYFLQYLWFRQLPMARVAPDQFSSRL